MFVEHYCFVFEVLASFHEEVNEGPEEYNLAEVEVGRCYFRMLNMEPMEYYTFSDKARCIIV